MRASIFVPLVLLGLATSAEAQTKKATRDVERFDVSGLPATPRTELERQISLFVKVHRKGDLTDATRIHMMLAQYYKEKGDASRAEDCNRLAAEAYGVTSDASPETAGSDGKPPFTPERTLRRTYVYTDSLQVSHTWEFYVDGTFSHEVSGGPASATETGWYTRRDRELRLWQLKPAVDRTVQFELIGPDGTDGAVMGGLRMKPGT